MANDIPRVASGVSIYEFVREYLDPAGRFERSGFALPDEAKVMTGGLKWAAGAMDGAFGRRGGGGQSAEKAMSAADSFEKACRRPSRRRLRKLYDAVLDDSVLDFVEGPDSLRGAPA